MSTTELAPAVQRLRKYVQQHVASSPVMYLVGRDRNTCWLYAMLPQLERWIPVPLGGFAAATVNAGEQAGVVRLERLAKDEVPPDLVAAINRHEKTPWRGLGNVQKLTVPPKVRPFPHRAFPCGPCPIRSDNCDNPAAKFPAARWEALSRTLPDPLTGMPPLPTEPMFGCHKGKPGSDENNPRPEDDLACAGWLVQFGYDHLAVRMALMDGRLPPSALEPGENWPPLHPTWDDVVRHQTDHTASCPAASGIDVRHNH